MVQAALATTVPMLLGGAAAAGGSLAHQSRRDVDRPTVPSALPTIALSADNKKAIKALERQADKDKLFYILSQPEILGMIMTVGGIYASNKIKFSDDDTTNELLHSVSTMATVLIGLGYAGVGDLTTLIAAIAAGGASVFGDVDDIATDVVGGIIRGIWRTITPWTD